MIDAPDKDLAMLATSGHRPLWTNPTSSSTTWSAPCSSAPMVDDGSLLLHHSAPGEVASLTLHPVPTGDLVPTGDHPGRPGGIDLERLLRSEPRPPDRFDPETIAHLPPPALLPSRRCDSRRRSLALTARCSTWEWDDPVGPAVVPVHGSTGAPGRHRFRCWALVVGGRVVRFVGADLLGPHGARMEFRLHGIVPVVRASGPDTARSAGGRLAVETVAWLPQTLTPQCGATAADRRRLSRRGSPCPERHARRRGHRRRRRCRDPTRPPALEHRRIDRRRRSGLGNDHRVVHGGSRSTHRGAGTVGWHSIDPRPTVCSFAIGSFAPTSPLTKSSRGTDINQIWDTVQTWC